MICPLIFTYLFVFMCFTPTQRNGNPQHSAACRRPSDIPVRFVWYITNLYQRLNMHIICIQNTFKYQPFILQWTSDWALRIGLWFTQLPRVENRSSTKSCFMEKKDIDGGTLHGQYTAFSNALQLRPVKNRLYMHRYLWYLCMHWKNSQY